jgi:hypothetical protein
MYVDAIWSTGGNVTQFLLVLFVSLRLRFASHLQENNSLLAMESPLMNAKKSALIGLLVLAFGSSLRADPSAWISVDGYNSGDTITRPYGGSVTVTVRYSAYDPDGLLSGIRYNVWNADTSYFDNGGGGFASQSGYWGEVDQTVTLDSDGDWYFWTDAQNSDGASTSSGPWTDGFHINVNQAANQPPNPSISVDGFTNGATITRPYGSSLPLVVRYGATDPDGNLSGIRYNVWNASTGYFDNGGGGFVSQSGASGEVDKTATLDSDGDWYFWTDAQDSAGSYASTGPWGEGFHITVNQAANQPPNPSISADGFTNGATITRPYGGSLPLVVRYGATDPDGNLSGIRYNVWNATTGYFDNGGGGFASQSGASGEVDKTVTLDSDGDWYFWTDARDSAGAYATTGPWNEGVHITVNQAANQPPIPSISVDGFTNGATIIRPPGGSATVTVRYGANDPDGNLSGIRYNVWNATTGYFDNGGGGFVSQSGASGEVDKTVTLDSDGDWYFWTDAQDSAGAYATTGAWGSGFMITVPAPPNISDTVETFAFQVDGGVASTSSPKVGDVLRITSSATDQVGDLMQHNIRICRPEVPGGTDFGVTYPDSPAKWNDEGWGNPTNGNVDMGNREPFVHHLDDSENRSSSQRQVEIVLDAPGRWYIESYAENETNQSTSSPQSYIDVALPPLTTTISDYPINGVNGDHFVGAMYTPGGGRGLDGTWQSYWATMWQPSPNRGVDCPWQPFWAGHRVYPILPDPDSASGSRLSLDIRSVEDNKQAAIRLMDVGVDFAIVGDASCVSWYVWTDLAVTQLATIEEGFGEAATATGKPPVKITMFFGLEQDSNCWPPGRDWDTPFLDYTGTKNTTDIEIFNAKLQYIYDNYAHDSNIWFYYEGKPLLLLYTGMYGPSFGPAIEQGAPSPCTPDGKLDDYYLDQMQVSINGTPQKLRDVFTVRFLGSFLKGDPYPDSNPYYPTSLPGSPQYLGAGPYAINGTSYQNQIISGHWSYQEHNPGPGTIIFDQNGTATGFEAVTVLPKYESPELFGDGGGETSLFDQADRFRRLWTGIGGQSLVNSNEAIDITKNADIWRKALDVAIEKKPTFLLTIWTEYGSENDEQTPDLSQTVADNNKFGTLYGDILKAKIRVFKNQ